MRIKNTCFIALLALSSFSLFSQNTIPCYFDQYTNNKSLQAAEGKIQAALQKKLASAFKKYW